MMMKNWMICGALAFGLAACSQDPEPERSAAENVGAAVQSPADSQSETAKPTAKAQDVDAKPDEVKTPSAETETPAPSSSIPAAFLGVWDAETGTCSRESDLRLEISPQQIIFYESLGAVRDVSEIDASTVELTLAMEGEGEVWEDTYRLSLANDGEQLVTSYPEQIAANLVPRKKCPQ
ncbi:MAG: hypothetical protein ABJP34_05470 [Erythrobacter sp.]